MEAFRGHPRIGESRPEHNEASMRSAKWSEQEQSAAADANKTALAEANREYEKRFGHIFIVCAAGKNADEILDILHQRLRNDPATEIREAADQQRQITNIRLRKWLDE
jgi:2-oxo-4-hydroxy-4-carboxy-5-ureidoimidazoline decarboxylase